MNNFYFNLIEFYTLWGGSNINKLANSSQLNTLLSCYTASGSKRTKR